MNISRIKGKRLTQLLITRALCLAAFDVPALRDSASSELSYKCQEEAQAALKVAADGLTDEEPEDEAILDEFRDFLDEIKPEDFDA